MTIFASGWNIALGQTANSFASLQQPAFAKIAGLGGVNTSLYASQAFFLYNPALLRDNNKSQMALSYGFLPGGAGLTNLNYTFGIGELGVFGASMQYLSYGELQGYDNTGQPTTVFTPSDYVMMVSHARQANNIRLGATIKFANTGINGYNGNALLFDIGALFVHPQKDLTVGLVMQNFGVVTSDFSSTSSTTLPFDVQLGTSFKPLHMPVRFSITLHKLYQWDLSLPGESISGFNAVVDNSFRHVVVGMELLLNDHLSILGGYNHLRRKELKLDNRGGFSGLSFGFEIKIKKFQLVYALGGYHAAGTNHNFTLAVNLSEIITN